MTGTARGWPKVEGALQRPSLVWPSLHSQGHRAASNEGLGGAGRGGAVTHTRLGAHGAAGRRGASNTSPPRQPDSDTCRGGSARQKTPLRGTSCVAWPRRCAAGGSRWEGDISGRDVRFVGQCFSGAAAAAAGCRAALLWPRILSVTRRRVATCRIYSNKGAGSRVGGGPSRRYTMLASTRRGALPGPRRPARRLLVTEREECYAWK